jgi:hypothetical protein
MWWCSAHGLFSPSRSVRGGRRKQNSPCSCRTPSGHCPNRSAAVATFRSEAGREPAANNADGAGLSEPEAANYGCLHFANPPGRDQPPNMPPKASLKIANRRRSSPCYLNPTSRSTLPMSLLHRTKARRTCGAARPNPPPRERDEVVVEPVGFVP